MGWKTLDKSGGLLPVFLSGGFEILCSANKVAFSVLCGLLPSVCGLGRTFVRRTGKQWKR